MLPRGAAPQQANRQSAAAIKDEAVVLEGHAAHLLEAARSATEAEAVALKEEAAVEMAEAKEMEAQAKALVMPRRTPRTPHRPRADAASVQLSRSVVVAQSQRSRSAVAAQLQLHHQSCRVSLRPASACACALWLEHLPAACLWPRTRESAVATE